MIATRLSSVGQVAGVAAAALLCYLVSQSVASERAALAKVDRQIAGEQDAITKLTTEIATRSRLTQIESWNRQLALQAPRPGQYVESGVQLASLYAHDARPQLPLDPAIAPPHGPIEQVSLPAVQPVPAPAGVPAIAAAHPLPQPAPSRILPAIGRAPLPAGKPLPSRAPIEEVAFHVAAPAARTKAAPVDLLPEPLLRSAAYVRPRSSRFDDGREPVERTALVAAAGPLLSADIAGLAKAEQAKRVGGGAK